MTSHYVREIYHHKKKSPNSGSQRVHSPVKTSALGSKDPIVLNSHPPLTKQSASESE